MAVRSPARVVLVMLASAMASRGQTDVRDVIRRAVAADECNWKLARTYTFSEQVDLRYLDSQGHVKSREVESNDVLMVDGSPYRRLVARDGHPLSPIEEKKEQEKLDRSTVERRKETVAQRAQRLTEYERRPKWQRECWRELPEAFDFRLVREEVWDGSAAYVIEAMPRPGYQPSSVATKMLAHLRGTLWVNKQDYHLLKAEAEVVDTISVGLFLVRVAKGSRAALEQSRVKDDVWAPRHVRAFASARLGLLKVLRIEQEISYTQWGESQPGASIISQTRAR